MELSELRVFLTVAAERSFSRAAMKLHRTQPAVREDELQGNPGDYSQGLKRVPRRIQGRVLPQQGIVGAGEQQPED